MLHVNDRFGQYVASIHKQDPLAANYRPHEPWLLLYRTGRTERFETMTEARDEARKSWPACTFHKN